MWDFVVPALNGTLNVDTLLYGTVNGALRHDSLSHLLFCSSMTLLLNVVLNGTLVLHGVTFDFYLHVTPPLLRS